MGWFYDRSPQIKNSASTARDFLGQFDPRTALVNVAELRKHSQGAKLSEQSQDSCVHGL